MIRGLLGVFLAAVPAVAPDPPSRVGSPPSPADLVRSRIDTEARILEGFVEDLDGDGAGDLLLVLRDGEQRRLAWHRQRPGGRFEASADGTLAVPPDVVAFAIHDVREDPGPELLLFTRGGVFSLSTARAGLRGNLRRELSLPLFPDLATPRALPRWDLSADADGDGVPELLLLSDGILLALARAAAPAAAGSVPAPSLVPVASWHAVLRSDLAAGPAATYEPGRGGPRDTPRPTFLASLPSSRPDLLPERFLSRETSWALPALIAAGGGRVLEAASFEGGRLVIGPPDPRPGDPFPAGGGRVATDHALPGDADTVADLRFVDLDGDGREELVVIEEDPGGKAHVVRVHVLREDGGVREEPTARIKLGGVGVTFAFEDVDGDGIRDCIARQFDVPLGLTSLTPPRIQMNLLVFRGGPGGTLSRHPDLRRESRANPEDLAHPEVALLQDLSGDFDGDGLRDLVSTSPERGIEIRRLEGSPGGALHLAGEPFRVLSLDPDVVALRVVEASPDGVADLLLRREGGVELLVSRAAGVDGEPR